jgi:hypothetical protein
VIRAEYGPTLPALVSSRLGISRRAAGFAVAGLFVFLVAAVLAIRGGDGRDELVHRGEPAFTLQYPTDTMRRLTPEAGELARLEARRGPLTVTFAVRPVSFGGKPYLALPVEAGKYVEALEPRFGDVEVREEGRARIGDVVGYGLGFRSGPPGRRLVGREVLVFPGEILTGGVAMETRIDKAGRPLDEGDRDLIAIVRRVGTSLRFGAGGD